MRALTLLEMAAAMEGRLLGEVCVPRVTAICTDSRTVVPDSLFFAIRGETHDGHDHVFEALSRGAVAAVVSDPSKAPAEHRHGGRLIQVDDTTRALGRLAGWYRRQFAAQVVAVVGSNGKTTTKDMIATVLGCKHRGKSATASFNNHIGVPVTLLSVEPSDEFVVVEIGTNHPGEIAALSRMVKPDMAVVTSIGEEHLEFFGDLDGVAREEFAVLDALGGRAFVAVSEQAAAFMPGDTRRDLAMLTYGLSPEADLRAADVETDVDGARFRVNGRFGYRIPIIGRHNVLNALAAIAIGTRFRMTHDEVAGALAGVKPPPMRLQRVRAGGVTIINDAYNANPTSMKAAFAAFDELREPGRKVLVLGDMRELGEQATRCHDEVGREAGRSSARLILTVGAYARDMADGAISTGAASKRIYSFPGVEALIEKLNGLIEPGDVILLKASRAVRLERLADHLARATQPVAA